MRFGDVVDRNTAILMVAAVIPDVAQIPATEERESRSTFSLLAAFFSLSSNLHFFSHSLMNSTNPEAWLVDSVWN
jgi:hypothetical protein